MLDIRLNILQMCTIYSTLTLVSYFNDKTPYYTGKIHKLFFTEESVKTLKKAGLFNRVLARLTKICNTGQFGSENTGFKYDEGSNIGWLKWKNGTRVYYSLFDEKVVILVSQSGNKNNQDKDIKQAKEVKNEYEEE